MGERGPAPAPTALKLARGTRPDRVNRAEPRPDPLPGPPAPPEHLDPVGREAWESLAPPLHAAGVLTVLDLELFAVFCDVVARHRQAAIMLQAGVLAKGRRDRFVTNPAWRIYRDSVVLLRALAREFGLTPSARSGLLVNLHLVEAASALPSRDQASDAGGQGLPGPRPDGTNDIPWVNRS